MKTFSCIISLFLCASAADSAAQNFGTLDQTFGNAGVSEIKITPSSRAFAVAVQPDGKILAAGSSAAGFAITRRNADGSADNTFSVDGIDTGGFGVANSIVLQPDGKIVVSGSKDYSIAVARYNTDGSRDKSFNGNGIVTTQLCESNVKGTGLALQADGRIVATGSCNGMVALTRFKPDGSFDNSFNDSGKIVQNYQELSMTDISDALIQTDGKIIIVGTTDPFGPPEYDYNFLVMRYKTDGRRDSIFGVNGQMFLDFGGTFEYCNSSALQADGKLVIAGFTDNGENGTDFAIARLNPDGSLDKSFGISGKLRYNAGGSDVIKSIIVQPDGRLIAGGYSNDHFVLIRFNSDGSIDNSFGIDGIAKLTIGTVGDNIEALAIQNDGKIITAGWSEYPPIQPHFTRRFVLARYHGNWPSKIAGPAEKDEILLFPNPSKKVLYFKNINRSIFKVQILTTTGQLLLEQTADNMYAADISTLADGLYIIKLYQKDAEAVTRPFVIQN